MGIRADFLIKHVRPYGMDAWAAICKQTGPTSLTAFLLDRGVDQKQIDIAYNAWAQTAIAEISSDTIAYFVQSAETITEARWDTLYQTPASTIMFLNEPLLKELSYQSAKNANSEFLFDPAETIPIAVTIHKPQQPPVQPTYLLQASSATLMSDKNGDCFHFGEIHQ